MTRRSLAILALAASTSVGVNIGPFKFTDVAPTVEILPKAQFSAPFTRKAPRSTSKKSLLSHLNPRCEQNYSTSLYGGQNDEEYLTSITIGGQDFYVMVDTGSSDTWVVQEGFNCVNLTGNAAPTSACNFGSTGFNPNKSSTYQAIPNENINITYGSHEFVLGPLALETVTVGNMTVTSQEIGTITTAGWLGNAVSSGLMGLAFPDETSAYPGTNPDNDTFGDNVVYNPLFFNAVAEGVVSKSYFSVVLNRGSVADETNSTFDPDLGQVAFGGIANVSVTDTTVTLPVQGHTTVYSNDTKEYLWYLIDIDSYNFPGAPALTGFGKQAILDTGTTLMLLPTPIMKALGDAFEPPALNSSEYGGFIVACNATAPAFSVTIDGQNFTVDPKDLIVPGTVSPSGEVVCFSGVQDGGPPTNETIFILGDTFLHNVVTTFNVKTPSVTITQREAY